MSTHERDQSAFDATEKLDDEGCESLLSGTGVALDGRLLSFRADVALAVGRDPTPSPALAALLADGIVGAPPTAEVSHRPRGRVPARRRLRRRLISASLALKLWSLLGASTALAATAVGVSEVRPSTVTDVVQLLTPSGWGALGADEPPRRRPSGGGGDRPDVTTIPTPAPGSSGVAEQAPRPTVPPTAPPVTTSAVGRSSGTSIPSPPDTRANAPAPPEPGPPGSTPPPAPANGPPPAEPVAGAPGDRRSTPPADDADPGAEPPTDLRDSDDHALVPTPDRRR